MGLYPELQNCAMSFYKLTRSEILEKVHFLHPTVLSAASAVLIVLKTICATSGQRSNDYHGDFSKSKLCSLDFLSAKRGSEPVRNMQ
jgi:hypothetical protein